LTDINNNRVVFSSISFSRFACKTFASRSFLVSHEGRLKDALLQRKSFAGLGQRCFLVIAGTPTLRLAIDTGVLPEKIVEMWKEEVGQFKEFMSNELLH
jgi:hypothetical protein